MSYQEKKTASLVHGSEVDVFANAVSKGLGGGASLTLRQNATTNCQREA